MNLKEKIGEKLSVDIESAFFNVDNIISNFCASIGFYKLPPYSFTKKLNQYIIYQNDKSKNNIKLVSDTNLHHELFIEIIGDELLHMNLEFYLTYNNKGWSYKYGNIVITDKDGVILYDA